MLRIVEYTLFFIAVVLLQVFLFDNLNLGLYVHPMLCVAFIIMLPVDTKPVMVLLAGLSEGVALDLLTGYAGLNTIALLALAFIRPLLLRLSLGTDDLSEGGIPLPKRMGTGRFLRLCLLAVFFHSLVYFSFEILSWKFYHLTLLKILLSTIVTVPIVYFSHLLLLGVDSTSGKDKI